jgi:hypothetical protein
MLQFLIDNLFLMFGGRVFQQTVGIPMGTSCAPHLAELFLYSYEADFMQRYTVDYVFRLSYVIFYRKVLFNRPSLSIFMCRSRYKADLSVYVPII